MADTGHRYPRLALAGLMISLAMAGCSTREPASTTIASLPPAPPPALSSTGAPYSVDYTTMQCVPYARLRSGIGIFGDAHTWWETAAGRYPRGHMPVAGSVLVLQKTSRLAYGHVAVVTQQVNAREIKIDHANWQRGTIITGMPVLDVSPANDWTELRFWNQEAQVWGAVYPAEGFIYNAPPGAQTEPSDIGTTIISSQGQRYWAPQEPLP